MTATKKDFTISQTVYEGVTDPRLGRQKRHDSRSLDYLYPRRVDDPKTLKSIRHKTNIPTLNQGDIGSCTGNALTKAISHSPLWVAIVQALLSTTDADADEQVAVSIYSDATKLDPYSGTYPPTDTGSDGLSVAKVAVARKLISGFQHATDLNTALTALADGPEIIGIDWYQDMFTPDADGRLHPTGALAGGHEICVDELDVENERVWIHNSWGDGWGIEGRAYLTWADFETLLKAGGDVTILVPATEPAPKPTPPPAPKPTPTDPDAAFRKAAQRWLKEGHAAPHNKRFAREVSAWLKATNRGGDMTNTTDGKTHLVANDGTDWRSTRGPVDTEEARQADTEVDEAAAQGDGPAATNETKLENSVVEGSESSNDAKE